MRKLLHEAANVLITRVPKISPLKSWAVKLAEKTGLKKATVAAARKIALILSRIWRDGMTLARTGEKLPALAEFERDSPKAELGPIGKEAEQPLCRMLMCLNGDLAADQRRYSVPYAIMGRPGRLGREP